MSGFLDGLGSIFTKVTQWIPGRIEALKNEKARLINERKTLLKNPVTPDSSKRIIAIDVRMCQINEAIGSKASD